MKIRYTPEAFADRERIIEYLRERSPGSARNVAGGQPTAFQSSPSLPRCGLFSLHLLVSSNSFQFGIAAVTEFPHYHPQSGLYARHFSVFTL